MQVAVREGSSYSIRRAQLEDLIPIMEVNLKTLPEHYSDFFYVGSSQIIKRYAYAKNAPMHPAKINAPAICLFVIYLTRTAL